jgi:hypothetical protein
MEDFALEGRRGIEPGRPARSLLYHAFASPAVVTDGAGHALAAFPTAAEIGTVENYVFARRGGLWVTWGAPRRFVPYGADAGGPWLGFQAWRPDLHRILAARAAALGVRVIRPCRALEPLRARRRVTGVRTSGVP